MGVLLFGFFALLILSIPFGICWNIYWHFRKKGKRKAARIFAGLLGCGLLVVSYFVYTAFYPTDEFYEKEFQHIAGLPFPKSGEILTKDASYPDQHGDYSACALVEVSPQEYQAILQRIAQDSSFAATSLATDIPVRSDSFIKVAGNVTTESYAKRYSKGSSVQHAYQFIGFLADRKTIIIYRYSS
ncbi:hypothetical protein [Hymenobacter sp. UYP22]|uniref:hypothetical protein n=1 Tax=Hymenobacter sp. UYP22 TaxID=3156348 RepID=UPI0033978901